MSDQFKSVNNTLPPARLKFLFSQKGKRCVILRRGPSDWVRLILWDMVKNEFLPGQWLNGPIRDFDISPDGEHLIYFVSYHKTRAPYLWTAISKPPYFTALAMWPISDAWGGYCAFVDNSKIYIERGIYQDKLELSAKHTLKRYSLVDKVHNRDFGLGWKMERNGWIRAMSNDNPVGEGKFFAWKKNLLQKRLTLYLQYKTTKGGIKHNYWLESNEERITLPSVDCADLDPFGRLVVAQSGILSFAKVDDSNELILDEIADFNAQFPEEIIAPGHAKRW